MPAMLLSIQGKRFREHQISSLTLVGIQPSAARTSPVFHGQILQPNTRAYMTDYRELPARAAPNSTATAGSPSRSMTSIPGSTGVVKSSSTKALDDSPGSSVTSAPAKGDMLGQKRQASSDNLSGSMNRPGSGPLLGQAAQAVKKAKTVGTPAFDKKNMVGPRGNVAQPGGPGVRLNSSTSMEEVKQEAVRAVHQQRAQMEGQQKPNVINNGRQPMAATNAATSGAGMQIPGNVSMAAGTAPSMASVQKANTPGTMPMNVMQTSVNPGMNQAPVQIRPQMGAPGVSGMTGNEANMMGQANASSAAIAMSMAAAKTKGKAGAVAASKGRNPVASKTAGTVNPSSMPVTAPQVFPNVQNTNARYMQSRVVGRGNANAHATTNAAARAAAANYQMMHPMQPGQGRGGGQSRPHMLVPQVPMPNMAMVQRAGTVNTDFMAMLANRQPMMNQNNTGGQGQQQMNAPVLAPSPAAPKQPQQLQAQPQTQPQGQTQQHSAQQQVQSQQQAAAQQGQQGVSGQMQQQGLQSHQQGQAVQLAPQQRQHQMVPPRQVPGHLTQHPQNVQQASAQARQMNPAAHKMMQQRMMKTAVPHQEMKMSAASMTGEGQQDLDASAGSLAEMQQGLMNSTGAPQQVQMSSQEVPGAGGQDEMDARTLSALAEIDEVLKF